VEVRTISRPVRLKKRNRERSPSGVPSARFIQAHPRVEVYLVVVYFDFELELRRPEFQKIDRFVRSLTSRFRRDFVSVDDRIS